LEFRSRWPKKFQPFQGRGTGHGIVEAPALFISGAGRKFLLEAGHRQGAASLWKAVPGPALFLRPTYWPALSVFFCAIAF